MGVPENRRAATVEILVLIEPMAGNGFRATGGQPLPVVTEGPTREEALSKLREELQSRLRNGTELVPLEVTPQPHPLAEFAGMFKDDPYFEEVLEIMATNRRKTDAKPKAKRSMTVLDTDVLTLYQRGDPVVVNRVRALPLSELAVPIISVEEELTGWYTRLRRARKREDLAAVYQRLTSAVRFLAHFQILTFSEPAIVRFEQLRAAHRRVGKNDLRIAAIVLEAGAVLATRNMRDFKQVKGLLIEDWSR